MLDIRFNLNICLPFKKLPIMLWVNNNKKGSYHPINNQKINKGELKMKNNKFFSIFITLIMVILVGCSSSSTAAIPSVAVEEVTPEVIMTPTQEPTIQPIATPTQIPLKVNFSWKWDEVSSYQEEIFEIRDSKYDASKMLEKNRIERGNFYIYILEREFQGVFYYNGPPSYTYVEPPCTIMKESFGNGSDIKDVELCNLIVKSKYSFFTDSNDPRAWQWEEEGYYDTVFFMTEEEERNCFYEIDGGIIVLQKNNEVLFYEDENIPVNEFSSEEIEFIREGFTLIDRREIPSKGLCNFFDFKEEIKMDDGS